MVSPSNKGRAPKIAEGFLDERLILLPRKTILQLSIHPVAKRLYPARLGFFPKARGHLVRRDQPLREHLLIFCLGGKGHVRTGSWEGAVAASECVLLPAGHAHAYEADDTVPWTIAWVHVRGSHADEYLRSVRLDERSPKRASATQK
jgi:AraC-like ligand binding domain.